MNVSGTLCVSALVLAMLAATAGGAVAAPGRSTTVMIDGSASAAMACSSKGGIVSTLGGQTWCTTPSGACMSNNIYSGESSSININDTAAVRACFDVCGLVSTQGGQGVCIKPGTMMPDASSSAPPGREPSN